MDKLDLGEWTAYPSVARVLSFPKLGTAIWKKLPTKYEGDVLYYKLWNFWTRAGAQATINNYAFFRDYEAGDPRISTLLNAIGFPSKKAETEEDVWDRIGLLWKWLGVNAEINTEEYAALFTVPDAWPSIVDYAAYYVTHGKLVWSGCFTKAHVFVGLIGRAVYPRFRFGMAEAHHTEDGAPPTATHVYVAVYVADRWFYLDPTGVYHQGFPDYPKRKSVGLFTSVDYEHPHSFLPVPLSGFCGVPYLPT